MKFDGIEHCDHFDGESVFWLSVSDVPVNLQEMARGIDGENYSPGDFGVCVHYNHATAEFNFITDTDAQSGESRNIYYVDIDGEKHWAQADLPEPFSHRLFAACKKAYMEFERQGVRPSISQQMKEAQARVEADRGPTVPRKDAPDREER